MKRLALFLLALMVVAGMALAAQAKPDPKKGLEPFTYKENFETNELSAWASYPLWQDTAFDPNIRPNTMVPGDRSISLWRGSPRTPTSTITPAPRSSCTWSSPKIPRSGSAFISRPTLSPST